LICELFIQINPQIQDVLTNNSFQDYGIIGLFLNSFLSSTAIPLPTEILTSSLLIGGENHVLVGMALVLGPSIGGVLNYFIGFGGNRLLEKFKKRKDQKRVEQKNKNNKLLEKFSWSAVFFASWIPFVGDLILISAGAKKMKFTWFAVFMVAGKTFKTIVVVYGLGLIF
jgi:membrane protein YqaA with SNARE-associated domain